MGSAVSSFDAERGGGGASLDAEPVRARRTCLLLTCLLLAACHRGEPTTGASKEQPAVEKPEPRGKQGGTTKAAANVTTVLNVELPPGCEVYANDSGVGHHGASFTEVWVACWHSYDELVAWLDAQVQGGVIEARGSTWRAGDSSLRPYAPEDRPRGSRVPPKGARSLLFLGRTGKPTPCPPCEPDTHPPPGCHCS